MDLCLIAETASDLNATLMYIGSILMVFAGLGFVIFVHELGHFLAAKACGVKCEKFYVGFDIPLPKIAGVQLPSKLFHVQWGETEYGIGILPLGGYVKMLGQDDDPRKFKEEQARARALAGGDASKEAIGETIAHDPRSYPAKSVPQRMLIISAGVIMNLIFAVIMGAAAYSMGVSYSPTIIGAASPGWAGWTSDLRPGDKIVQIGKHGRRDEQLRFIQDLQPQILLNGGDTKLDLLVERDGKEEWKTVTPTDPADLGVALVGISPASEPVLNSGSPVAKHTPLAKLGDKLAGQRIVAINGEKIENHAQLQAYLALHPAEPLKLSLVPSGEDAATSTPVELELPAVPMRTLGIVVKLGPVVAVRENSPAIASGFMPGDEILTIDGQPVGDPMTLSQRMVANIGKDVTVQIERKSADGKKSKTQDLKITPEPPRYLSRGTTGFPGEKVAVEPFGLAFSITNEIAEVVPGSPADKAGLKAGDEISGAQFVISDEAQKKELLGEWRKEFFELMTLKPNGKNWAFITGALQVLPVEAKLEITYRRNNELKTVSLETVESQDGFVEARGLHFDALEKIRTAQNFSEAWGLGFQETTGKLSEVGQTLKRLVTGGIPATNLGGPLSIFTVARREATEGWARLLIFLTFLSANLALLNFLPIPVLDGGHMVFLIAEGLRGKPIDENTQGWALMVGMVFLLSLMVFVFGNDIFKLFLMSTAFWL